MRLYLRRLLISFVIFGVGQYGLSVGRAELRSRALWRQFEDGPGETVDLTRLGPCDWERVYIFHQCYPHKMIGPALGCDWRHAEGSVDEQTNLVVFVRARKVVGEFYHPRNRGDLTPVASDGGYSREEARFVVAPDRWQRLVAYSR